MGIAESATREALFVIAVLKLIPRQGYTTISDIKQRLEEDGCEVSVRKLQRLLKDICSNSEFGVECNTAGKPYGYRRVVHDSDLSTTRLRPQECLLLRLAEEHLHYQLPSPIMKLLEPLFDSAKVNLNETGSTARQRAWLKKVAFVPDAIALMPPKILPRIFDAVSEGLYRDSKLNIEYESTSGKRDCYTVSPLGLVQQEHRLYLICQFENYANIRHLALHRMKNVEVLDFPAERPKNFSLEAYVNQRHINYSNGRKCKLIIEFTNAYTAKILEETPFNRTQKIEKCDQDKWRLEAIMDDTVLLDGWYAAWKTAAGITRFEKEPLE